jgi:hypothetical protein
MEPYRFSGLMHSLRGVWGLQGDCTMIGRRYWTRQAMTVLKFATLTKNPELAAVLIEKAAELKSQVDDTSPPKDVSPRAPDVEPSP